MPGSCPRAFAQFAPSPKHHSQDTCFIQDLTQMLPPSELSPNHFAQNGPSEVTLLTLAFSVSQTQSSTQYLCVMYLPPKGDLVCSVTPDRHLQSSLSAASLPDAGGRWAGMRSGGSVQGLCPSCPGRLPALRDSEPPREPKDKAGRASSPEKPGSGAEAQPQTRP